MVIWEDINNNNNTSVWYRRAKIFGGWLVEGSCNVIHVMPYGNLDSGYDWRMSLTFVFDPFHLWRI